MECEYLMDHYLLQKREMSGKIFNKLLTDEVIYIQQITCFENLPSIKPEAMYESI